MDTKLIITALSSATLAFFVGYNSRSVPSDISIEVRSPGKLTAEVDSQKKGSANYSGKRKALSRSGQRSVSRKARSPVSQVMADMHSLLGDSGMMSMDFAAFAEAYNLIKNLNEDELIEALTLVQQNPNTQAKMFPMMLLLGRYGEVQPRNAMTYYEENIKNRQMKMMSLNSIVSSWAKNDPQGAFEWYKQKEESDPSTTRQGGRATSLNANFQGLAKENLDDALTKLSEIKVDGWKGQMAASGITSSLRDKEDFLYFF